MTSALSIFLSSTCYNLVDLRAELGSFLGSNGYHVRMSDNPESGFAVDPDADSIESCLANVRSADVLLCIIDGRHGPNVGGKYGDVPATPLEVTEALSLQKPLLFFIRSLAYNEYQQLRGNPSAKHYWVEKGDKDRATAWTEWVASLFQLPQHRDRNTWFDQFTNIVDLKALVLKRIVDRFPTQSIYNAMRPERLVRLTFRPRSFDNAMGTVMGKFVNVGVGPALNVRVSMRDTFGQSERLLRNLGGLGEGESVGEGDSREMPFESVNGKPFSIVAICEYENRFGDRYRVEQSFEFDSAKDGYRLDGHELFYVGLKTEKEVSWRKTY